MALSIREDSLNELVNMRYEALKEAGFDEDTASRFARVYSSVNEAIDAILSRSLSASELSEMRITCGKNLPISESSLSSATPTSAAVTPSAISGVFSGKSANTNGGHASAAGMDAVRLQSSASQSLGLKLISDIDDCLGSILESDDERQSAPNTDDQNSDLIENSDHIYSATNDCCDNISGDNLLSNRSLSPPNFFGIDFSRPKSTIGNNSYKIDLNKHTLGSHVVPNHHFGSNSFNRHNNNSIAMTGFLNPPKKTFADIASTNTKKAVQPPKTLTQALHSRTISAVKSIDNSISNKDIVITRPLSVHENLGNKMSSLESFSTTVIDGKVSPSGLSADENKPTNLMAYKGLWVCNISPDASYVTLKKIFRKYGNFTGLQTFERKATNGSNIVFVHYDNAQSPSDAIAELFGVYRKDICFDEFTPLKLRFTPSMEQTKAGDLPSMEKAKRVVEKSGECFNWRLSSGCHKGERCALKHIPINKSIDSQPWVKALKKKTNEI